MSKSQCPVCHRSKIDIALLCGDCSEEFLATQPDGRSPVAAAVWAGERAWKFAAGELEAAIGAMNTAARRAEGRPGDPGRSRRRR